MRKGAKIVYSATDNNEKEVITTLITCNAAGQLAPRLLLFAYQKVPSHIINKVSKGWAVGYPEIGYMTGENFFQ